MREPRTYLKIALALTFFILLSLYALYQSRFLILGPQLTLITPLDGTTVREALVPVQGQVSNASFIYLNDRQIFADEHGVFHELLLAQNGYNIMTARVKDSFGRERKEVRQFMYKPSSASSTAHSTQGRE